MSLKAKLIDYWENRIVERENRNAQIAALWASRLWHKGNLWNKLLAMVLFNRNIHRYHCEIYPQAQLGEGLYIPHCVGIVIGSTAVIGRNCTIYPNVVVGAKHGPNDKGGRGRRHAVIGDSCSLGANCTVIGAVTIGRDVTIGAGAVITKDVPDYAIVVGENRIIGYRARK